MSYGIKEKQIINRALMPKYDELFGNVISRAH